MGGAFNNTAPEPTTPVQPPMQYYEYPSNIGGMSSQTDNWIAFEATGFKSQRPTFEVALYIPGDALTTSYKSEYESTGLGTMLGQGAGALKMSDGAEGKFNLDSFKTAMAATASGVKSEAAQVALIEAAKLGTGLAAGAKTVMEQKLGAVLNPYIVAAYKGPTDMRTHEFSFKMLPQDANESKACIKIVNAFKKAMLPSHGGGDAKTSPSMMFGYPDTFKITYYINGEKLPATSSNPMFNIGKSVLLACDLDFTTESVPLFFDQTQYPVTIAMKLSFMELEVMYRERIKEGA